MANQIVQLTDDSSNNIFPIAGGMASNSVTTNMFAQNAVNEATKTTNNLAPSTDLPTAWAALYGGDGYFWTYFNTNSFTNQPSEYGFLETIITGNQIYQRWGTHTEGSILYRVGNGNGWYGMANYTGVFRLVLDSPDFFTARVSKDIPANADLNTLEYCQPGVYTCAAYATASTLINSPTDTSFRMEVFNGSGGVINITSSTAWANLIRKITDIEGRQYIQVIRSSGDATPVWTYRAWAPTYSTRYLINVELDTGQTWVDGKRIYKKTIDIGRLPSTPSEKFVAHNITGMHMLVKIEASAKNSTTGVYYPLPYLYGTDSTGSSNIGVTVTNTGVGVHVGGDRSDLDTCYVTIYYTKN